MVAKHKREQTSTSKAAYMEEKDRELPLFFIICIVY